MSFCYSGGRTTLPRIRFLWPYLRQVLLGVVHWRTKLLLQRRNILQVLERVVLALHYICLLNCGGLINTRWHRLCLCFLDLVVHCLSAWGLLGKVRLSFIEALVRLIDNRILFQASIGIHAAFRETWLMQSVCLVFSSSGSSSSCSCLSLPFLMALRLIKVDSLTSAVIWWGCIAGVLLYYREWDLGLDARMGCLHLGLHFELVSPLFRRVLLWIRRELGRIRLIPSSTLVEARLQWQLASYHHRLTS